MRVLGRAKRDVDLFAGGQWGVTAICILISVQVLYEVFMITIKIKTLMILPVSPLDKDIMAERTLHWLKTLETQHRAATDIFLVWIRGYEIRKGAGCIT